VTLGPRGFGQPLPAANAGVSDPLRSAPQRWEDQRLGHVVQQGMPVPQAGIIPRHPPAKPPMRSVATLAGTEVHAARSRLQTPAVPSPAAVVRSAVRSVTPLMMHTAHQPALTRYNR